MTNAAMRWVSFGSAETCSIYTDSRPDLVMEGLVHLADSSDRSMRIYKRITA
ncbi:hypothetical protein J2X53_004385 [Pseudorhodobacter sp. 4114]|nr:hypothetical protein [Pseudorhodobacter sp. 4114]